MASRGDIDKHEIAPVLCDRWTLLPFEEVLIRPGDFVKLKANDFTNEGKYPVVDQGEKFISGYIDDEGLLYQGELPVIIFGDHTRIIKYIDFKFAVGADGTKILKPKKGIGNKFIFYYLKALNIPSLGYSRHYKILRALDFPIVPIPEQQRIVAKLDTLFGRLDQLKARLENIPTLLKQFRQAVLTQAVTGKLTEDWRDKNNLSSVNLELINKERERLQRANAEKRGQKSFKYKNPVQIEIGNRSKGVDFLPSIPKNWTWASLEQVLWSVSDGPHFSPNYVLADNGVPFISARNLSYYEIDFSDAKYVSDADHSEFIKRGSPERGDVLLTKGGTTGIAHVIKTDMRFSIWVHVALLKVIKNFVVPEYLRDVLTSDFLYVQSQAQTHGVGNQDLGLTRMIFMTIPVPPVEEQKEIVRRVESLFAMADRIKASYNTLQENIDRLPQAILGKAFRGELVEQEVKEERLSEKLETEMEKLVVLATPAEAEISYGKEKND